MLVVLVIIKIIHDSLKAGNTIADKILLHCLKHYTKKFKVFTF